MIREERIGDCREVLIYALTYPGTDRVRYVGKTVRSPRKRHNEHIMNAQRGAQLPVQHWIKSLYDRGLWSCLWHLERVPESKDWAARERYWIEKFRADGHDLLNLTTGGEGLPGLVRSKETREKIAAGLKTGRHFHCEVCAREFWRKRNQIKKGQCRFCSKVCYQIWQRGKPKGRKK